MHNKNVSFSTMPPSPFPDKRRDTDTAQAVKAALRLQRELGYEPAFLSLRARGVDPDLARILLDSRSDRRKT